MSEPTKRTPEHTGWRRPPFAFRSGNVRSMFTVPIDARPAPVISVGHALSEGHSGRWRWAVHDKGKVFGIGFQKTGTSSLAASFYVLGYNVCGYYGNDDPDIAETALATAFEMADHYDAAQDMPWPVLYRELDDRYPGSKFILTVRDSDSWIRSVVGHFKSLHVHSHAWIYGVPTAAGHEAEYVERFERHNREVLEYFADRPDDLLVLDLMKGGGWEQICPFLGLPIPDVPYPRQNTRNQKLRMLPRRVFDLVLRRTAELLERYDRDDKNDEDERETNVARKVTADVVRETVHFHYETMVRLMSTLEQAVHDPDSGADARAVLQARRLVADQTAMERRLLAAITGTTPTGPGSSSDETPAADDLPTVLADARRVRDAVRHYLANVDDLAVNRRLPGRSEQVWQAFIQMQHEGAERRARLRFLLEQLGADHGTEPYVDLTSDRPSLRRAPLTAMRTLLPD